MHSLAAIAPTTDNGDNDMTTMTYNTNPHYEIFGQMRRDYKRLALIPYSDGAQRAVSELHRLRNENARMKTPKYRFINLHDRSGRCIPID